VWCGVVWCGVVWCGVVWCGVVWCGVVWCGVVWCGVCVYIGVSQLQTLYITKLTSHFFLSLIPFTGPLRTPDLYGAAAVVKDRDEEEEEGRMG
jgi:hypothetical protein